MKKFTQFDILRVQSINRHFYFNRMWNKIDNKERGEKTMEKKVVDLFEVGIEAMGVEIKKLGLTGCAVVAYLEDEKTVDWKGNIQVFGSIEIPPVKNQYLGWNLIAMACSKAGETMNTHLPSAQATSIRPLLNGEEPVGSQGAAIEKCNKGFVVAAFGGCTSQEDYEISKAGCAAMVKMLSEK